MCVAHHAHLTAYVVPGVAFAAATAWGVFHRHRTAGGAAPEVPPLVPSLDPFVTRMRSDDFRPTISPGALRAPNYER